MTRLLLHALLADGPRSLPGLLEGQELEQLYAPLPPATYSALRSYEACRLLHLEDHIERTRRSMESMGWSAELAEDGLRAALSAALTDAPWGESKLRYDVFERPIAFGDVQTRILVATQPLPQVQAEWLRTGVRLTMTRALARTAPLVKSSAWVRERAPYLVQQRDAFDALMIDGDNLVREGSTCNFFVVLDGRLATPASGVLEGVTRRIVLELAEREGIATELRPLSVQELKVAQEAFITSSSRHLVPVVALGELTLGPGHPGPLTQRLMESYDAYALEAARAPLPRPG